MALDKMNISVDGKEQNDLSFSEVLELLIAKKILPTDYYYCQKEEDWKMLAENSEVMVELKKSTKPKSNKPSPTSPLKSDTDNATAEENESVKATDFNTLKTNPMLSEWYILKGENKFGPFPYTDVIKMLQQKVVFEFDFAWQNGMEAWVRIAEIKDFCPENIQNLQNSLMPEIKNVFFRRKHPRVPFECSVVVHDNKNVWQGQAVELSEGGAGLIMENSLVVPGQKLYMHFKSDDDFPAFNAICEVVSKKFVDGVKEKRAPICYGVKFTNLSGNTHEFLKHFTKTQVEKEAA